MARFLLDTDYNSIIQSADLTQIHGGTVSYLYDSEKKAIDRIRTKLAGRYMVDIELSTMTTYSASKHYRTKERVLTGSVIDSVKEFDRWVSTTAYVTNDIVTDDDGYVYTAIADSQGKVLTNTTYWSPMVNIINSNATYWDIATDNRYSLFIEVAMDLALYNLYSRINPRNIPDLRINRYKESMNLLDEWAGGEVKAEVMEVMASEQTGFSIRYGSSFSKSDNNY